MLHLLTLTVFPALMAFAAFSDLFTMTISNRISIVLVLAFVPLAYFSGVAPAEIGIHLACGAGVLLLTFALFAFGWIGGGDAKLAAATAVWVGWNALADYGLEATIVGGGLTLVILQFRKWPVPQWGLSLGWLMRLHDRKAGVPYGIALAIAGVLVYPTTSLWLAASVA